MHKCSVPTCNTVVPSSKLMCGQHWAMVPRDVQREIHAGYREMKADESVRRWVEAKDMALRLIAHEIGDPSFA
jgi:hypothetical protein